MQLGSLRLKEGGLINSLFALLILYAQDPAASHAGVARSQMVDCAASAAATLPEALPARFLPEEEELLEWARRAEPDVEPSEAMRRLMRDVEASAPYFAAMMRDDPEAFSAHRAYCAALAD